MARTNSTLRNRFAQSKFAAKTNFISPPVCSSLNTQPCGPDVEPFVNTLSGLTIAPPPELNFSTFINDTLPTTLETLRAHVHYLLRLPLPVAEKNRLRLKCWAMERRLEAVRLLLEQADDNEIVLSEMQIDPSCFDLSDFDYSQFTLPVLP